MNGFMGLVVLGTSIWMGMDASRLGYDKRDIKGLAAMGPAGWFFAGLLLWIVAFPVYLVKRSELKAAGEQRKRMLSAGPGAFAPMPPPGMPIQPPPGPRISQDDAIAAIAKLGELRASGVLTEEEFQRKKADLLSRT